MDVLIPPDIPIAEIEWRILDNTAVSTSPLNGVTTTFTRPGTRWGARLSFRDLKDRDRARLLAILAAVRGRSGRIYFTSAADPARTGGSGFPELFTNADFASGTTGWVGAGAALSVSDRVMRVTRSVGSAESDLIQAITGFTQYAPHALRSFILDGKGSTGLNIGRAMAAGVGAGTEISDYSTARGLGTVSLVARGTTSENQFPAVIASNSLAGDYISVPWCSLSRCALVDNGPNALLYSDQIDNAAWTKTRTSITANAAIAPDGTSTADAIVEDTSASTNHIVTQSSTRASVAEDLCAYGYFKRGSGTRDVRMYVLVDGSNYAGCTFDLGAGTAGTPGLNGSATNTRAFIRDAGNGWYYCAVLARCPATTGLNIEIDMVSAGSTSYTGDGTSSIYAWRLGAARSGLPTRGALTAGTALASGTNQTGSGLYLKGLPANTQNIRAAGDMVEIVLPTYSQLVRLTAALDSDAAGLGYLQFENPVRTSPADNAAVIFNQPMMRGILSEGPAWPTRPGLFSDFDLDLIEDIAP